MLRRISSILIIFQLLLAQLVFASNKGKAGQDPALFGAESFPYTCELQSGDSPWFKIQFILTVKKSASTGEYNMIQDIAVFVAYWDYEFLNSFGITTNLGKYGSSLMRMGDKSIQMQSNTEDLPLITDMDIDGWKQELKRIGKSISIRAGNEAPDEMIDKMLTKPEYIKDTRSFLIALQMQINIQTMKNKT